MKKWLLLGGGALALVGISIGGSYLLLGSDNTGNPQTAAALEPIAAETFYVPFRPEFVVNFGEGHGTQYLMVDITAATEDSKVPNIIDTHMPALRNDLLLLLTRSANEELFTEEGKATLRQSALQTIDAVVKKYLGQSGVTDVFFTRFVMQ